MSKKSPPRSKARPSASRRPRRPSKPERPSRSTARSASAAPPQERRPDESLVARTLDMLQAHDRAVAASKRRIGAHILDHYFAGQPALVRSTSPTKPQSYARLVARAGDESTWDVRDLREAVRIELAARSLPAQVADSLPPTYLLWLAAVDDLETRRTLAARISSGDLRGEPAQSAIAEAASMDRHGGKPRASGPERFIAELERDLERAQSDHLFSPGALSDLPAATRTTLARRLAQARTDLVYFEDLLTAPASEASPSDPASSDA